MRATQQLVPERLVTYLSTFQKERHSILEKVSDAPARKDCLLPLVLISSRLFLFQRYIGTRRERSTFFLFHIVQRVRLRTLEAKALSTKTCAS